MPKKSSLFYMSINKKITERSKNHKTKDEAKPKFYEGIANKRKKR